MILEVTKCTEDWTKDDCQQNEGRVPVVLVVDGIDAQEHEDDRFRAAAQHLHGVLDGRVRFGRNVAFDVVLHRDSAKSNPASIENVIIKSQSFNRIKY